MNLILSSIDLLVPLLLLWAGPYRALAWKSRTLGGVGRGAVTWAGIVLVFPLCTGLFSAWDTGGLVAWAALIACAYVQTTVAWCSQAPRRDNAAPHCWLGGGEMLLAGLLCLAAAWADELAVAAFFLAGYACSAAEWRLQRLKRQWDASPPAARKRFGDPVGDAVALIAGVLTVCLLCIASVPRLIWSFLTRRRRAATAAPPQYVPAPSLSGRVIRFMGGHLLWQMITGVIGFNLLSIPLALVLMLFGWKVSLPERMKAQSRDFIERAKDAFKDEKEEMVERLRLKREALEERFDEEKARIREEISRRKRQSQRNNSYR